MHGDLYLGRMHTGKREWTRPGFAERWLLAELRRQGVEIAE